MKRLIVNVSIALVAFLTGVACEHAFNKYLEVTSPGFFTHFPRQPALISLARPLPSEERFGIELPPGSLPAELQRIDDMYRRRCQLPTDWRGEWPTIKQLAQFRTCNDKWATARRKAISAELDNYKVQY